jgi:type IV secretion system protein VirD4
VWTLLTLLGALAAALGTLQLLHAPVASLELRCAVSFCGALTALLARKAWSPKEPSRSYGSAGFAGRGDIAELLSPPSEPLPFGSVLLGKLGEERIALPRPYTGQHGIIVAGSGMGKSFGFFLPNMALAKGVSCIVTDPKSEIWSYTSGYHNSTRFAPTEPEASGCFNWIPLCKDARMASLCARAVVEAGATERQEAPWPDLEAAFLASLFSHASVLSVPTPLTAYNLLTRTEPAKLMGMFLTSPSIVAREQAVIFEQTHERMRGSITPVLAAKLQWLRDPDVARFTSATFAAPDFGRLRVSPESLYWCVREQDIALLRPLSSLFFTVLLEQIAGEKASATQPVPVHLYFDEFANIGILPHYETTISLARGRGLSIWHGIQSLSQLEALYGKPNAQTILTNCATKIALGGLDVETADYFSRALGEGTAIVPRRTWQKKRFALVSMTTSDTTMEHVRPLLTSDEVRRIGSDKSLVIAGNRRPLLLDRIVYTDPPRTAVTSPLGPARTLPVELPTLTSAPVVSSEPPLLPSEFKSDRPRKSARKSRKTASTTVIQKPVS